MAHLPQIWKGRESYVSPFQGSSHSIIFPTVETVGYDLWPLRGHAELRYVALLSLGRL